jgi:hypothetical protein
MQDVRRSDVRATVDVPVLAELAFAAMSQEKSR